LHSDGLQNRTVKEETPSYTHLSTAESSNEGDSSSKTNGLNLDLSTENYELDISKMIKDIGDEDVPVIKRNYDEVKPIHGNITAAKFLTECWPSSETEAEPQDIKKRAS